MKLSLIVLVCAAWTALAAPVALNSSVLIFHRFDLDRVKAQVDRALGLGNKKINFVVTLHGIVDPQTWRVQSYCYMPGDGRNCQAITPEAIAYYSDQLTQVFTYAAAKGASLAVVPHLDDGKQSGLWRNNYVFDPLESLAGFSYFDAMIEPTVRALKAALHYGVTAELALQGESGATVFHYARSYEAIVAKLKKYFANDARARVGISLNFNRIAGSIVANANQTGNHNDDENGLHNNVPSGFDYSPEQIADVQSLIYAADFIGISAYAPVPVAVVAEDFNRAIRTFIDELGQMYGLVVPIDKDMHFSEIGLGGGTTKNDGKTPAKTPEEAAAAPWAGNYFAYDVLNDPWTLPAMKDFRYAFHAALLDFLARPEIQLRSIRAAFLWNANSWDAQGLYPDNESYGDPRIIELLKAPAIARD